MEAPIVPVGLCLRSYGAVFSYERGIPGTRLPRRHCARASSTEPRVKALRGSFPPRSRIRCPGLGAFCQSVIKKIIQGKVNVIRPPSSTEHPPEGPCMVTALLARPFWKLNLRSPQIWTPFLSTCVSKRAQRARVSRFPLSSFADLARVKSSKKGSRTGAFSNEAAWLVLSGGGRDCMRNYSLLVSFFFFLFITLGLELSDTKVYEP